jgi:hypothetical protein
MDSESDLALAVTRSRRERRAPGQAGGDDGYEDEDEDEDGEDAVLDASTAIRSYLSSAARNELHILPEYDLNVALQNYVDKSDNSAISEYVAQVIDRCHCGYRRRRRRRHRHRHRHHKGETLSDPTTLLLLGSLIERVLRDTQKFLMLNATAATSPDAIQELVKERLATFLPDDSSLAGESSSAVSTSAHIGLPESPTTTPTKPHPYNSTVLATPTSARAATRNIAPITTPVRVKPEPPSRTDNTSVQSVYCLWKCLVSITTAPY